MKETAPIMMISKIIYLLSKYSYRIVMIVFGVYMFVYYIILDLIFTDTIPVYYSYIFWYLFGLFSGFFLVKEIQRKYAR